MRLSGFDEYPFRQHPTPFNTVATSDAHYNDGYWFAFYAPDWYFNCGLRLHPYDTKAADDPTGPPHVPSKRRLGPTEFPMRMIGPGGAAGMAHFEHTIAGSYPRYGFP